jgi:hypothetical protein
LKKTLSSRSDKNLHKRKNKSGKTLSVKKMMMTKIVRRKKEEHNKRFKQRRGLRKLQYFLKEQ